MSGTEKPSFNVYQSITDSIVAAIEAGAGAYKMPWNRTGTAGGLPQNALTGHRYRGVNVLALWAAAASCGYAMPLWATYRQWTKLGAQVRRGATASVIVFYRKVDVRSDNEEDDDAETQTRLLARASWVFNASQVDGYTPSSPVESGEPVIPAKGADAFVERTGADIVYGGGSAFYAVASDLIQMPEPRRFIGTSTSSPTEAFYSTLFHELVHWSGAGHRLARDLYNRFGSDAYAMEELVAELGAAFLCAEFTISPEPRADHAAYIGHWLDVLKADNRAIFSAASKAAEALDYLLVLDDTDGDENDCQARVARVSD